MKKSELIWVLVRFSGALTLFYAFFVVLGTVQSFLAAASLGPEMMTSASGMVSIAIGLSLVKSLFFVILGLYLIKDGRLLYAVLDSEEDSEQDTPSLFD